MRGFMLIATIGAAAWLSGCGENCQSTCRHVYSESECDLGIAGVPPSEQIASCVRECEEALKHPGEARFDPNTTPASDDRYGAVQNEEEAALWIDCVWSQVPTEGKTKECGNIDPSIAGSICAPI